MYTELETWRYCTNITAALAVAYAILSSSFCLWSGGASRGVEAPHLCGWNKLCFLILQWGLKIPLGLLNAWYHCKSIISRRRTSSRQMHEAIGNSGRYTRTRLSCNIASSVVWGWSADYTVVLFRIISNVLFGRSPMISVAQSYSWQRYGMTSAS